MKKPKTKIRICLRCGIRRKCYIKGYCKICNRIISREFRENNPEKVKDWSNTWKKNNFARLKNYQRLKQKLLRKNGLNNLKHTCRVYLRYFLNSYMENNNYVPRSKWFKMVGCDIAKYVAHLLYSYSGKVKLSELQIDHVTPLSSAKTRAEVIKLCHYTNLRLIRTEENKTGRVSK